MGALTTIQGALNTKCFKYWAAWQNLLYCTKMYVQVCALCFPTPVISPFSCVKLPTAPLCSLQKWKKICTCTSEKWAHTFQQCLGPLLKSMQVLQRCFGYRAQPEAFLSRVVFCAVRSWNEEVRRQNEAILYNLHNNREIGYGFLARRVLKGLFQQNFPS